MKISDPNLKRFIAEVVFFTTDVDLNKQKVVRTSFNKEIIKGVLEIREKIFKAVEIGYLQPGVVLEPDTKVVPIDQLEWLTVGVKPKDGCTPFSERHTDAEIELSAEAVKAFRHYYNAIDELPDYVMNSLSDLDLIMTEEK